MDQEPKNTEQKPEQNSPYNFEYFEEMNRKAAEKQQQEAKKKQKRQASGTVGNSAPKKKSAEKKQKRRKEQTSPPAKPSGKPAVAPQAKPVGTPAPAQPAKPVGKAAPPPSRARSAPPAAEPQDPVVAGRPEPVTEQPQAKKRFPRDPLPKKSRKQFKTPEERKRYVRRVRALIGMGGAFVMILIVSILCMTVLFRIDEVEVIGASRYPQQEIEEASGVKNGQNLFTLNENEVAERIMTEKPYVKSVSISRRLPSKIVIEVTDMTVVGAVQRDNKYVVIGTNGKMLEEVDKLPSNCPLLVGAKLTKVEEGKEIEFEEEQQKVALDAFAEALENGDIEKLTKVDISETYNIKATYDGRIEMEFGSPTEMNYKFRFATAVLNSGKIKTGQKGTMDLTQVSELNRVFFAPDFSTMTKADQEAAKKLSDLTGLQNGTVAAVTGDLDYGSLIGLPGTLGYGTSSDNSSSSDKENDEDTAEGEDTADEEEADEDEGAADDEGSGEDE